ncbi:MAG: hypothetical protein ONB30_05115 [candidate division KSB1 bacterium]|nr:hypothetical protein [candidate division KSB1 bacterium]
MYKSKLFLLGRDRDSLSVLEETGYVREGTLQEFLAMYPDLLPGDQIDPENPRRWLLVAREIGVPGDMEEGGRWSLDLLFLDQHGIPTFVECKRASDTRARREVVAQMLDYAAHGTEYWTIDRLRQMAAETAKAQGRSLDEDVFHLLGEEEGDVEEYWETVAANLREHRVRLVFVSDSTPKELRRLVEFLNEEMTRVEVLAVEVKQFRESGAEGQTILAPRVIGLTESARSRKEASRSPRRPTTQEEFMNTCESPAVRAFFERVLELAEQRGHVVYWGTVGFSVRARLPERRATFLLCFPHGSFSFYFDQAFRAGEAPGSLRKRLLASGVFRESGNWTLTATVGEDNVEQMNSVYDLVLDEMDKLLAAFGEDADED